MTDQDITEFQSAFKGHFGKDLTKQEALDKLLALVSIMRLTYKPMTQKDFDVIANRKNM